MVVNQQVKTIVYTTTIHVLVLDRSDTMAFHVIDIVY